MPWSTRCPFARMLVLLPLAAGALLAGCARVPETGAIAQVRRRLTVTAQVAGRINPAYYYFIALDATGNAAVGPLPVVSAPYGNGWGTGEITHFVRYHLGQYQVLRFREDSNLLLEDLIGVPFEFNQPEQPPGNLLRVVLDLDTLRGEDAPPLDRVNLNLMTTDRVQYEPSFLASKLYDGLGQTGNHYINFSVNETRIINNATALFDDPEGPGDLPPQPTGDVVPEDLDLVDWSVEVRINQ